MYYVDSHIHLQDYTAQDVKNVVTSAEKNNVRAFINVSAHPDDWPQVLELSQNAPQIIPAVGVHPWYIDQAPASWADNLAHLLEQHPDLWIGECGIDRHKNLDTSTQLAFLNQHINLANRYRRPLIIHAVKANNEFQKLFARLPQCTIFHSFTGSAEWGREIQKRGFFLGINFSILRKPAYAQILRALNPHQILLETDGPYQSGQPAVASYPHNIPDLARQIAGAYQINKVEFTRILFHNWLKFKGE